MTLATGVAVSLMLRRTQDAGGFATVLSKGGAEGGGILVQCAERGLTTALMERQMASGFRYEWRPTGPDSPEKWADYVALRKKSDPDLWVIELDVADAQRFVADNFAFD
ncbi:DUF1491 domain-containing protein [Sphingomonas antarctica]|uniref:DUF1491 family protein n=1 Tax=Sphingomonas antarctica TaxID=2040274 RepID=UPI0039EA01BC